VLKESQVPIIAGKMRKRHPCNPTISAGDSVARDKPERMLSAANNVIPYGSARADGRYQRQSSAADGTTVIKNLRRGHRTTDVPKNARDRNVRTRQNLLISRRPRYAAERVRSQDYLTEMLPLARDALSKSRVAKTIVGDAFTLESYFNDPTATLGKTILQPSPPMHPWQRTQKRGRE
jgi:hypothetical protein